jgi:hypothetical protein
MEMVVWRRVFGPVANADQTRQLAEGELLRLLAESPWYPFMLLPGPKVQWEPENESQAWVQLKADGLTARVLVTFNEDHTIAKVESKERYREVKGTFEKTPWSGYFRDYEQINGIRVPTRAWVQWELPAGALPYWKGHITSITYQ